MKRFLVSLVILIFVLSVSALALDKVEVSEKGFDRIFPSYSDIIVVKNNGLYGAIDTNSNVVVEIKYKDYLPPNKDGITAFRDNDGNALVFDKNGKQIAKFANSGIFGIADGVISVKSNSKVSYIELSNTANIIATFDNVVKATPFNDGYAALTLSEKTVIIDRRGNEVYTDDGKLEPMAAVSEGYAMFSTEDEEDFFMSYYIVDIANKQRINITPYPVESNSSFEVVDKTVKDFYEFFTFRTDDMISVYVLDGMGIVQTQDLNTYAVVNHVYTKNGLAGSLRFVDAYEAGEKYFFTNITEYDGYFSDVSGNKVGGNIEAVSDFKDGRTVVYTDDGFLFVNDSFEPISETFAGVDWVYSAGNVFYALKGTKQHVISLKSAVNTPSTPSNPSTPPAPAVYAGMHNFVKSSAYNNVFSDVKGHWALENIKSAYETGIMFGTSPSLFSPDGKVTVAQLLTMAARLHSIYNTGKAEFVQGEVWYEVYTDYCLKNGIITSATFDSFTREATRAEVARVMTKVFPDSEFALKNDINTIPDVPSANPDFAAILKLYRSGVVTGKDGLNFKPDDFIKRSEMSAILTRLIDATLRKTV